MINSNLPDVVTGHYFRMCSFVQVKKHDLRGMSAINTAVIGAGAPDVVYTQKRRIWRDNWTDSAVCPIHRGFILTAMSITEREGIADGG